MSFEVEQKYPVASTAELMARLEQLGARPGEVQSQADCYYAHPQRDFARTDEALRLRSQGPRNTLTYKGPKIDADSKTRREVQTPIADGAASAEAADTLLRLLGFAPAGTVRKRRSLYYLGAAPQQVEIAVDDVEGLGQFVELELVVARGPEEAAAIAEAKRRLADVARQLGLEQQVRASYLEMVLNRET
jgi:adenylate cyclase class 2